MGQRVLVTGAGGFIGSHLVEELIIQGEHVRAFVRYNSRGDLGLLERLPREIKQEMEIVQGDIKDSDAVRKTVKNCKVVYHLGALIAIPYSYIHPLDFVQTNILGTTNVLNACMDFKVEKMVHTSTSEVYGTAQYTPIDEQHPLQGQSPYSASKIGADKLVESYNLAFDLPVTTVRPFNTFGPRQSARAVIPTIITQALTSSKLALGNLEPRRDLLYVKDTVRGFILAAKCQHNLGKVINLGTGQSVSIGELAQKIIKLIGKEVILEQDKRRLRPVKSEVMNLVADIKLAKKLLSWTPNYNLDEGLSQTIDWIKNHLGLYKVDQYNL